MGENLILLLLGLICIIWGGIASSSARNEYRTIKHAMNNNITSKCTKLKCNAVTPITWTNDKQIAQYFESPFTGGGVGGKWNINSGPTTGTPPASFNFNETAYTFPNNVFAVESANNLGNALGTLKERKNNFQLISVLGLILCFMGVLPALINSSM